MTTATKQLLQKGDRITGTSAKGNVYTGTFEGFTTDDWIKCSTGEKTIALNPATVERDAPELESEPIIDTPEAPAIDDSQVEDALTIAESDNLVDRLATEIEAIWAEAEEAESTMRQAGTAALQRSLTLGEKLLEAKALPEIGGYGRWLPWLSDRGITERQAQRAIRLWHHRQQLEAQADSMTELTLTEALAAISKKALMPAEHPNESRNVQDSSVSIQNSSLLSPEAIETQFAAIGDHATPTLEQLMTLYSQIGTVRRWKKGCAVERDDMGAPFPLAFRDRASAWKRWQEEWKGFAVKHSFVTTEASDQVEHDPTTAQRLAILLASLLAVQAID
ncbi:MAG: DUF3102 domain-containing protein [Stenomitos rutilans HA7619-LM2]|jgi:hypothetical protein|nr:DUF3102 domain-containing protein [Stenomitos rutilans HA7619-LM2]MBW4469334.1 DUF3102 domain-containing protein [Stenomitos rutilans HA7619-LM2]